MSIVFSRRKNSVDLKYFSIRICCGTICDITNCVFIFFHLFQNFLCRINNYSCITLRQFQRFSNSALVPDPSSRDTAVTAPIADRSGNGSSSVPHAVIPVASIIIISRSADFRMFFSLPFYTAPLSIIDFPVSSSRFIKATLSQASSAMLTQLSAIRSKLYMIPEKYLVIDASQTSFLHGLKCALLYFFSALCIFSYF